MKHPNKLEETDKKFKRKIGIVLISYKTYDILKKAAFAKLKSDTNFLRVYSAYTHYLILEIYKFYEGYYFNGKEWKYSKDSKKKHMYSFPSLIQQIEKLNTDQDKTYLPRFKYEKLVKKNHELLKYFKDFRDDIISHPNIVLEPLPEFDEKLKQFFGFFKASAKLFFSDLDPNKLAKDIEQIEFENSEFIKYIKSKS